ncbi:AAA family ATPase [Candidatus Berkiella aquae]|uniref:AAA family ATPase n=1 Tax=Candidatus Berkiella aquae TaxID=295108 RepID=A0A0Q9YLE0_9GAMM|nr:bifunctional aminoglycoside phosphotransferase/ATP-binding protein [Candidatus Berkiella aquae]MCS5710226.1 AAA family ATPase [Candidatus Berkiella aquae]
MSNELITALKNPACYPHDSTNIEVIETHLSWVILTGSFAYKIKKPLNLGFQDFTTLEKRKHYCELEVKYNRQLAGQLYIGVVGISGNASNPSLREEHEAFEYAVKMHQFPQENLLRTMALQKKLSVNIIDNISKQLASFHQQATICPAELPYGSPDEIYVPLMENFTVLRKLPLAASHLSLIEKIANKTQTTFEELRSFMQHRKEQNYIRACHGDLHLGNIVLNNNQPVIFDCIEFNEGFRYTDVMSDVAFLAMDLDHCYASSLGYHFINAYLELTQDYEGLKLLRFYQCYRAMVRAKVSALLHQQLAPTDAEAKQLQTEFVTILSLAERYCELYNPELTIMMGPSGSGKTLYSQQLLEKNGAIRLRSDVLRKHLHHLSPLTQSTALQKETLYSEESTQTLYRHMQKLAALIMNSRFSVIIDATCLKEWQRALFLTVAKQHQSRFNILLFICSIDILEQRIAHRAKLSDASEADNDVLAKQLDEAEPLTDEEEEFVSLVSEELIDNLIVEKEKQYA